MSAPRRYDDANDPSFYAPKRARASQAIDQASIEQRWAQPARRLKSSRPAEDLEDSYQARAEAQDGTAQWSAASWASLEPERVAPPPDNPKSTNGIRFVVITVAVAAVITLIIVVVNAVRQGQNSANAPLTDLASPRFQVAGALSNRAPPQPQPTDAQMVLAAPETPPSTQPAPTTRHIEAVQSAQTAQEQMNQISAIEQKRAIEQRQTADRLVHAAPSLPSRTSSPSPPSAGEEQLLARAAALIGQGDIMGARLVLERAIEAGSARAAFALARTYDPLMLSSWNTYGIRGDLARARELYARAYVGGIAEAKERMEALK